jgi:hypothetical protein
MPKAMQATRRWSPRNPWPMSGDWRTDVINHYRIRTQPDAFSDDELIELEKLWKENRPPAELDRTLRRKLYRIQSGGQWVE